MINVTKTYLPPIEKYNEVLKRAWDKSWLTNNGELVQELEEKLKDYLGVKHLFYCTNGTIVLQMAIKALGLTQEVITTPFSYVATLNTILWEGCTPVFVDIDPNSFCIEADKIEAAITDKTEAILATHVFGFPCAIEKIEKLAQKYNLKVIYDGAHAFGSFYENKSLLSYGDISTCSFHATKIFHSVEGGCVITNNDEIARDLMLYRQFGHVYDDYYSVGINAKNSEFHAAMGICVFEDFNKILEKRKQIYQWYLAGIDAAHIKMPVVNKAAFISNYSYVPVMLSAEEQLLKVLEAFKKENIFPRRYFYPSLNKLPFINGETCAVSEDISKRILCLPSYHDLTEKEVKQIVAILNNNAC